MGVCGSHDPRMAAFRRTLRLCFPPAFRIRVMAMCRGVAMFAGPFPVRGRIRASWNTGSGTRWRRFPIKHDPGQGIHNLAPLARIIRGRNMAGKRWAGHAETSTVGVLHHSCKSNRGPPTGVQAIARTPAVSVLTCPRLGPKDAASYLSEPKKRNSDLWPTRPSPRSAPARVKPAMP
jgi:hypothetical protein